MHQEAREELSIRLKLSVLEYTKYFGVTAACRKFDVEKWKNRI